MVLSETIRVRTNGIGLTEISDQLEALARKSKCRNGIMNVFCQHTSCSLVIMENADPSASDDLVEYLNRLVPPHQDFFTHTAEGPDDMPSHIKMALTRTSETIPVRDGRLMTGTWQGVFLWEHRERAHGRNIVVTVLGD